MYTLSNILGPQPFAKVTWSGDGNAYVVGIFVEMEPGRHGLIEYTSEHEFFMDALNAAVDTKLSVTIDPDLYS